MILINRIINRNKKIEFKYVHKKGYPLFYYNREWKGYENDHKVNDLFTIDGIPYIILEVNKQKKFCIVTLDNI